MKARCFVLTAVVAAMAALCGVSHAIERVAATPYTGDAANLKTINLSLPTCAAGEALTSLGGNTFSCVKVKDDLPPCGGTQALAVSGNTFICASVVQNAPKCDEGYGLVGDGNQTLSCVKTETPPACDAGQVLTSDQGAFKCVTLNTSKEIPVCDASQVLTTQNGELVCKQISQTNCDGRVVQNWGGVNYCSNMTCGDDQMLSMVNGYMTCKTVNVTLPGGAEFPPVVTARVKNIASGPAFGAAGFTQREYTNLEMASHAVQAGTLAAECPPGYSEVPDVEFRVTGIVTNAMVNGMLGRKLTVTNTRFSEPIAPKRTSDYLTVGSLVSTGGGDQGSGYAIQGGETLIYPRDTVTCYRTK